MCLLQLPDAVHACSHTYITNYQLTAANKVYTVRFKHATTRVLKNTDSTDFLFFCGVDHEPRITLSVFGCVHIVTDPVSDEISY